MTSLRSTIKSIIELCGNKKQFVFYSESKFYNFHYLELIKNLTQKYKNKIYYLTSDPKDKVFKNNKRINHFYIGNGLLKFIILSTIKCDFFVTTLTDIGKNIFKSRNCKEYIYFFHSFASTNQIYKFEAFKYYDYIFCVGEYHLKEIIEYEEKFRFPKKKTINCGYFYLDYLMKSSSKKLMQRDQVLFAPSWNYEYKNLFNDYGLDIINILLKNNFKIVFRPHPEILKRSIKKFNEIKKIFDKELSFSIDLSSCPKKSLESSEILITDNSTISMEFLFVFKRPTLFINYKKKIHNVNFHKSHNTPFENVVKNKFGSEIDIKNIKTLPKVLKEIKKKKPLKGEVDRFLKKNVFNIGNSAKIAAKILNDISN
jgi:hypothetical protein